MSLFEVPVKGLLSHNVRGRTLFLLLYNDSGFK